MSVFAAAFRMSERRLYIQCTGGIGQFLHRHHYARTLEQIAGNGFNATNDLVAELPFDRCNNDFYSWAAPFSRIRHTAEFGSDSYGHYRCRKPTKRCRPVRYGLKNVLEDAVVLHENLHQIPGDRFERLYVLTRCEQKRASCLSVRAGDHFAHRLTVLEGLRRSDSKRICIALLLGRDNKHQQANLLAVGCFKVHTLRHRHQSDHKIAPLIRQWGRAMPLAMTVEPRVSRS